MSLDASYRPLTCYIDYGAARLQGLQDDLNLSDSQCDSPLSSYSTGGR